MPKGTILGIHPVSANSEASVHALDLPTSVQIWLFPRVPDCRANIHTKTIPAITCFLRQSIISRPSHSSPLARPIASPIASMTSQVKSFCPVCRDTRPPYKNTRTPRDHGKTWPVCRCPSSPQAEAQRRLKEGSQSQQTPKPAMKQNTFAHI